jgi:ectoine hydroxylase-related dioxygenase (phytanoyl-CoA dioxygenase family)
LGNCLWAIPGSQKWPDFLAAQMIEHLTNDGHSLLLLDLYPLFVNQLTGSIIFGFAGFKTSGAVPIEVEPGDCIFHNILLLHGSQSSTSPLRRTIYYEYRSIAQELKMGPHKPEYIPLKQSTFAFWVDRSLSLSL